MSALNDGGPAFPQNTFEELRDGVATITDPKAPGMSLRDYFAAKAMQAMIQTGMKQNRGALARFWRWLLGEPVKIIWSTPNDEQAAERAYTHADAMLVARTKQP